MNDHERYIRRCLDLASKGLGRVAPNPMVGCVIVHNDDIIAEGYHMQYGQVHAEVNAIRQVPDSDLLMQCTLYVNLEPCSHHGKTPPCSDLIIEKKIRRVVIGCRDTNPLVAGRGIWKLREAGVDVIEDVLGDECTHLNRRFFKWHRDKRPYVILKWAQTSDGFTDRIRGLEKGMNRITGDASRRLVHLWRSQEQSILIGANTLRIDNPSLTVRYVDGVNPLRIVLLSTPDPDPASCIFHEDADTIVFHRHGIADEKVHELFKKNHPRTLFIHTAEEPMIAHVLGELYKRNIQSLIVEGGTFTHNQFLTAGLWDETRVLTAPVSFEEGLRAPYHDSAPVEQFQSGEDAVDIYYNR